MVIIGILVVKKAMEVIKMKVRGNCEICLEPIVLGDMTLHKSGKYLCVNCQIDLNNEIEVKEIYRRRRKELLNQLSEINRELNNDITIGYE